MMRFFGSRRASRTNQRSEDVRNNDDLRRRQAFDSAILPHLDAAYSYACYLSQDRAAAEDIVQDALLRAFRGFEGFRGEAARAWLFTIVRNCFFTSFSDKYPSSAEQLVNGSELSLIDDNTPESIVADRQEAARLRRTIAALPQPFREVLVLRELEELSYREIALVIDAPIGTVMSRLARARQMLADVLLVDATSHEGLNR